MNLIKQLGAVCLERGKRAGLIGSHEPGIAHHVSGQYGCKPAFHAVILPRGQTVSITGWQIHALSSWCRRPGWFANIPDGWHDG